MSRKSSILFPLSLLRNTPAGRRPENAHLFENGQIRPLKKQKFETGKIITRVYPQKSKEKMSIEFHLLEFANKKGLVLYGEYYFHPTRKWRFDWAIPDLKLAVEYNGIISEKSRHTTIRGYSEDMNKINAAIKAGWNVLQYTPLNCGNVEQDLYKLNLS